MAIWRIGGGYPGGQTYPYASTRYSLPFGYLLQSNTEAQESCTARAAFTMGNLYAYLSANTWNNSVTILNRKAGGDGAMAISVEASGTGAYEDTVNTDEYATGNALGFAVNANTPTSGTGTIQVLSATCSGTDPMVGNSGGESITGGLTRYLPALGGYLSPTSTTTRPRYRLSSAMSFKNLQCYVTSNSSAASTLKVRKDGVAGNLSVSIAASGTGRFEDTTNSDTFASGEAIDLVATIGSGGSVMIRNTTMQVYDATRKVVAVQTGGGASNGPGLTRYLTLFGASPQYPGSTESVCQTIMRWAGTARNLLSYVDTNTLNGATTITLRKDTGGGPADTNLQVSVEASGTGFYEDTDTESFAATDKLNFQWISGGSSGTWYIQSIGIETDLTSSTEKTLTESFSLSDSLLRVPSKLFSDSFTITDSIIRFVQRKFSDSLANSDTIRRLTSKARSDSIANTDTIRKLTSKIRSDSATLTDVVTRLTSKVRSESMTLTDTLRRLTSKVRSESVTLTDTMSKLTSKLRTEAVTLTDSILRTLTKTLSDKLWLIDVDNPVVDTFEWGSDGTPVDDADIYGSIIDDWVSYEAGAGFIGIATGQAYEGTRSLGFQRSDAGWPAAETYKRIAASYSYDMTARIRRGTNGGWWFEHGDGTRSMAIFGNSGGWLGYYDYNDQWTAIAQIVNADTWYLLECKNIDFSACLYDLWFDGTFRGRLGMRPRSGLTNGLRIGAVGETTGTWCWFDNVGWRPYKTTLSLIKSALSDSFTLSDSISKFATTIKGEAIVIGDSISTIRAYLRTLSDAIGLSDSLIRFLSRSLSEAVTLGDTFSALKAYLRTFSESVALSDTVSRFASTVKSEALSLSDFVRRLVMKTRSESVTLSDMATRQSSKTRSESVSLSDVIRRSASKTRSEAISLTDTILKMPIKVALDAIALGDSMSRVWAYVRTLPESIGNTDTLKRAASRIWSESITLSDTATKLTSRIHSEAVSLTDSLTRAASKVLSDTMTLVDSLSKLRPKTLSESIANTDTIYRIIGIMKTEVMSNLDALSRFLSRLFSQESIAIADLDIALLKGYFRTLSEAISIVDSIRRDIQYHITNSISLVDTANKGLTRLLGTESISLSDQMSKLRFVPKTFSEAISLADSTIKSVMKAVSESVRATEIGAQLKDDFEWGNDGDPLSNSGGQITWVLYCPGDAKAEIATGQAYSGTRSFGSYTDSVPNYGAAYANLLHFAKTGVTIRFCARRSSTSSWRLSFGNGSKQIAILSSSVTGVYYYIDTAWAWHNMGGDTMPQDTWVRFEFRNVDYESGLYDFYVNDVLHSSGVPMRNEASYAGRFTLSGTSSSPPGWHWYENVEIIAPKPALFLDKYPFAELLTLAGSMLRSLSKQIAETINSSDVIAKLTSRTSLESIGFVDSVVPMRAIFRELVDAVALTDYLAKFTAKQISENIGLVANPFKSITKQAFQEAANLADSVENVIAIFLNLEESISLAESTIKKAVSTTRLETVNLIATVAKFFQTFKSESFSLTDILDAEKLIRLVFLSETMSLSDIMVKQIAIAFIESITPSETLRKLIVRSQFIEAIGLVDSFAKTFGQLILRYGFRSAKFIRSRLDGFFTDR